ncbi:MAG: glutamate-1-semialdehyde 2,1-aminomutase [Deltaproteobacteria bacterium]|nr:glutamate-1-semialdehyde 2,1-aminomutase [Deltaproteobacteria bacterium]
MKTDESTRLFDEAKKLMPGGVNSPVRAFRAVHGIPRVIVRGSGSHVWDADGNKYIDLVSSWGPLVAGHAHPRVVQAIYETAKRGTTFGAPCPAELELARQVVQRIGVAEKVRFVNSGTEAVMTAVRLARGATGRDKIIIFSGCYHGHSDALLAAGGSGMATLGIPSTPGVTSSAVKDTIVLPLDDKAAVSRAFDENKGQIAAVIIEPAPANAGLLIQDREFLNFLRETCSREQSLLVFDEVITGFRVAKGGMTELLGIEPDLMTLGKIIGGGLPVGAIAGPASLMEELAPNGPVYQAGTLSGNPLAMAAGAATLDLLDDEAYDKLEGLGLKLEEEMKNALARTGVRGSVARLGSVLWLCLGRHTPPRVHEPDEEGARLYAGVHAGLLERGVYMAPSAYEVAFVSLAHTEEDIARIGSALFEALKEAA